MVGINEELDLALELAYEVHKEQLDKGGKPYVLHPLRVGYKCLKFGIQYAIVGILHDTVEDGEGITFEKLLELGFSEVTVNSLQLLTHDKNQEYMDYINTIKTSKDIYAIKVKEEDLKDNMNINRIANPTCKDYKRVDKYKNALEELTREFLCGF